MTKKQGQPSDDVTSAPESGTVRDVQKRNDASNRSDDPVQKKKDGEGADSTTANEEA